MQAGSAFAEQEHWAAYCNDGQKISYTQMAGGKGELTLYVRDFRGNRTHGIVLAELRQSFKNSISICATPKGNETRLQSGELMPIAQVCMNLPRQIISVSIVNPDLSSASSGVFCSASVRMWTR